LVGVAGCSSKEEHTSEVPISYQNLRTIGQVYMQATKENGSPPQSAAEIIPFIKDKKLDPATVLTSPDDGQPYVIHWGVDYRDSNIFPVLAYEKEGKGGKRYVCQFRLINHMTDDELRQAPFPPGKSPP
jgi:hypothetical protein